MTWIPYVVENPRVDSRGERLPTLRTKAPNEVLDRGFLHGLGHGVGLEIHEAPYLHTNDEPLLPAT